MQCRPSARDRVRSLCRAVECDDRVISAEAVPPEQGEQPQWTACLLLEPRAGGAPPALQAETRSRSLTLRTRRQGPYWDVLCLP